MDRVHKGGAKFDFEKAKWYNHEWIKKLPVSNYEGRVKEIFDAKGIAITDAAYFTQVLELVKDRCTLLPDFYEQAAYFFVAPATLDVDSVKPKWTAAKTDFFVEYIQRLTAIEKFEFADIELEFKNLAAEKAIKPGELQLPMRIMLVGGKFGPAVFSIAEMIGKDETIARIENALLQFNA